MTTEFNPYRRIVFILLAIALFVAVVGMACDDTQPCANACGITSPVGEVEQGVREVLAGDNPQNVLSGGNNP